jgi:hypothetical protein
MKFIEHENRDLTYWNIRVPELEKHAMELETRKGQAHARLNRTLAGNKQLPNDHPYREGLRRAQADLEDVLGGLHEARKFQRRAKAAAADKAAAAKVEQLQKFQEQREKAYSAAERSFKTFVKKFAESENATIEMRGYGDAPMGSQLNERGNLAALWIAAQLVEMLPHATSALATALSYPNETKRQVADKSFAEMIGNPVTDYEDRHPNRAGF